MLAVLALADRELMEKIISETFRHVSAPPARKRTGNRQDQEGRPAEGAYNWSRRLGTKSVAKIEECRQVLATEPPERFTAYWGSVRSSFLGVPLSPPFSFTF